MRKMDDVRRKHFMPISLGPVERVPVGEGRAVRVGDRTVAVFRTRQGRVFVTQATCPHRGGPLFDGVIDERCVVCPLHARRFDLETGEPAGEGCEPLETYPATVSDAGEIVALMPADDGPRAGEGDAPQGPPAASPALDVADG